MELAELREKAPQKDPQVRRGKEEDAKEPRKAEDKEEREYTDTGQEGRNYAPKPPQRKRPKTKHAGRGVGLFLEESLQEMPWDDVEAEEALQFQENALQAMSGFPGPCTPLNPLNRKL